MNRNLARGARMLAWGIALALSGAPPPATAQQVVGSAAELVAAVAAANNGSGPLEIVVQSGTYPMTSQLWLRANGTIVRGQSGSPGSVILEGSGMTSGLTHMFQVTGHDVTISDMTIRRVWNHAVQVHGEGASADRTVLKNLIIQDCGQQMVKVSYQNGNPASAEDGLIENCVFEYTAGIGPQFYIGGVDAHQARNWTVRGCTFRGIRSPDSNVAEHAVHFWSDSQGTLVEKNLIVNCDRGIGFGLGNRGHVGGVIRNNMIYHADLGADRGDVGIELESASGAEVYNNTVYQEHPHPAAISIRWAASSVYVANNLLRTGGAGQVIWKRNGPDVTEQANLLTAQPSWFVDTASADLRLRTPVVVVVDQGVAVPGLVDDFEGDARPQGAGPDIGADEARTSGGSGVSQDSWGVVKGRYR